MIVAVTKILKATITETEIGRVSASVSLTRTRIRAKTVRRK